MRIAHRIAAVAIVLFALPTSSWAQAWDPIRYLEICQEADATYTRAEALPVGYEDSRRELLTETLLLKQQALEMLRRAVLSGEVTEIDPQYQDAIQDIFNLSENVLYLLIELDQCTAAELQLGYALDDPFILPPGAVQHLESLRPLLEECRQRIAAYQHLWDFQRYQEEAQLAEDYRLAASIALTEGDEGAFREATFENIQHNARALTILREAMLGGQVNRDNPTASNQLFHLYHALISGFLSLDQCDAANRRIQQAIQDAGDFRDTHPEEFADREGEIRDCEVRAAERSRSSSEQADVIVVPEYDPTPLPSRVDVGVTPWILIGVAGASGLTALGIDLATASDRDELDSIRGQCAAGACDYHRALELSDSINDKRVVIGVLSGVGVVSGVIGLVMLLTADTKPETGNPPAAEVSPILGFDEVGVRVVF